MVEHENMILRMVDVENCLAGPVYSKNQYNYEVYAVCISFVLRLKSWQPFCCSIVTCLVSGQILR